MVGHNQFDVICMGLTVTHMGWPMRFCTPGLVCTMQQCVVNPIMTD